jgi:hypothetical protein
MDLKFESIRSDWYAANTLVPRLFVNAVCKKELLTLVGFPSQWIPVCIHYGVPYTAPRPPLRYIPLFSDLTTIEVERIAKSALSRRASRALLETTAAVDPVIADLIYILDHKLHAAGCADPAGSGNVNLLNTWHSFGAVDLWRIFMLLRGFLAVNRFAVVVDCLSFKPYSDMLDVLCRMGIISKPIRPLKIRWRGFHVSFG